MVSSLWAPNRRALSQVGAG